MKNTETFCESVLNAIHTEFPWKVKDSNIVYACYLLACFYSDLSRSRGDKKAALEWKYRADDFSEQFYDLRTEFYKKLKESGKPIRDARNQANKSFDLKKSILESHFNKKYGIFEFHNISFG